SRGAGAADDRGRSTGVARGRCVERAIATSRPERPGGRMSSPKRIGILGGISPQSTLEYYRRIVEGTVKRTGGDRYPEIVIYSLDFRRFTKLESGGPEYVDYVAGGVAALERAGAEIGLMAANSVHAVYDAVASRARMPLVSIVEATLAEAQRREL